MHNAEADGLVLEGGASKPHNALWMQTQGEEMGGGERYISRDPQHCFLRSIRKSSAQIPACCFPAVVP